MQAFWSMTTGPSAYLVIASTGQTAAHIGKSQCMQLLRPQTGDRPSSTGGSIVIQVLSESSYSDVRGRSFQSLHACTHCRQPMHAVASNRIDRGLPSASCPVGKGAALLLIEPPGCRMPNMVRCS